MSKQDYTSPWVERLPDGTKVPYGPTAGTHARHTADFELWSWRPPRLPSRRSMGPEADRIRAYVRPGGLHLRVDVPRRELEVYLLVFEQGRTVRWVARHMQVTRSSVRTWVLRLRGRAEQ